MKRLSIFSFLIVCLVLNLSAQDHAKSLNSPKENSTVNREYDENGNLIRFDSTYTYSWSSDTSLMNQFSPEDMKAFFEGHSKFFSDSTFMGKSFFDGFDQFFAEPFINNQDSVLMKSFGIHPNFHGDSLSINFPEFEDFFNFRNMDKNDSIPLGKIKPGSQIPNSGEFDQMMEMLHEQMRAMEERHRKFFEEKQNWKEF